MIFDEQPKNHECVCRKPERAKVRKSSNICSHHMENEPFALSKFSKLLASNCSCLRS
jgi:hypothetical protein